MTSTDGRFRASELTPLQRAEALARRYFPDAKVSSSFGSVVVVETDAVPPWTSILVSNPSLHGQRPTSTRREN